MSECSVASAAGERKRLKGDSIRKVLPALAEEGYGEISEGPRGGLQYKQTPMRRWEEGWTG